MMMMSSTDPISSLKQFTSSLVKIYRFCFTLMLFNIVLPLNYRFEVHVEVHAGSIYEEDDARNCTCD